MVQLTDQQIEFACKDVLQRSLQYQVTQYVAFLTQFQTGCREGEVIELWRWSINSMAQYELITEKGNGYRSFDPADLPIEFRQWIALSQVARAPTSTQRMRSSFNQLCVYGPLSVGNKGVSTHLFRYNYMRSLRAAGKTNDQIRDIMGLSSGRIVSGYLNNRVMGNPPLFPPSFP